MKDDLLLEAKLYPGRIVFEFDETDDGVFDDYYELYMIIKFKCVDDNERWVRINMNKLKYKVSEKMVIEKMRLPLTLAMNGETFDDPDWIKD